jgi:hypothetical protein
MSSKEENSDFTYLGKRIDKALNYVQTNKPGLIEWFKEYIETPYLNIIYGELELEEEDYTFDYLDSLLDDIEEKFNIIFETKQIMSNEFKRMMELAGLPITENKVEEDTTETLNENFVGIPAINNVFEREKTDYELAFEHFTKGTSLNEEMDSMDFDMKKEELLEKVKNLKDFGLTGDEIEFNGLLITCSTQEDENETPQYFVYEKEDESEDGVFNSTNPEEIVEFVLNY